ncbi:MAG: hypothetical protein RL112_1764 [Planctomycetota bacterium]
MSDQASMEHLLPSIAFALLLLLLVSVPVVVALLVARVRALRRRVELLEQREAARDASTATGGASATDSTRAVDRPASEPASGLSMPAPAAPPIPPAPLVVAPVASAPDAPLREPDPSVGGASIAQRQAGFERWVGVRGAALLGGIALAIAGWLFVQYSIEHGLLGPRARLLIGAFVGLAALALSALLARRGYALLANAIHAGGSVGLFAVAWAAHMLYGLVGLPMAFGAMCVVTAASAWTALKRDSQLVAVVGLVGGFATPLVLSRGGNQPVQLFGYVLLLDLAFLFVASRRRWPSLATLAVLGTTLLQGAWIVLRAEPGQGGVALVVLGLFALLFAFFGLARADADQRGFAFARAAALILPFAFAAWFAHDARFGPDLWPLACLAALLSIAAHVVAARGGHPQLPVGAAAGGAALLAAWLAGREFHLSTGAGWQLCAAISGLSLLHALGLEHSGRGGETERREAARLASSVHLLPSLWLLLPAALRARELPIAGLALVSLVAGLVLLRRLAHGGRAWWTVAGMALAGVATWMWSAKHDGVDDAQWMRPLAYAAAVAAPVLAHAALAGLLVAGRSRVAAAAIAIEFACLAFAMVAAHGFAVGTPELAIVALLAAACATVLLALRAGARLPHALVALASLSAMVSLGRKVDAESARALLLVVAAFAAPAAIVACARDACAWTRRAWALQWFAAAWIVAPLAERHWSLQHLGWPLVAWGALAACLSLAARALGRDPHAWLAAGLLCAAFGVAHARDEWIAGPAFALHALLVAAAWRRARHAPHAWLAGAVAALATVALLVHASRASFDETRVLVNANAWNLLLPAACLGVAGWLLSSSPSRIPAVCASIGAIVAAFAWINAEIVDGYAPEAVRFVGLSRLPQRDLLLSIAWAAYSLLLLVLGLQARLAAARWASLALLLLTIAKVFLLDLGRLDGLWRAASMLGLALSLLLVSFLYQRFVFRKPEAS